ncbi:MAG: glycosyltransferase family A protein [Waterburya sp.]
MSNKYLLVTLYSLLKASLLFNCHTFFRSPENILAQTYEHWKLLLVDDGSTDGSTAIALKYAEQYPDQIRYLQHPNQPEFGIRKLRY